VIVKKGHRFIVEMEPMLAALLDPRLGEAAFDLMVACGASALGLSGEKRECFGCCEPWAPDRHLVAMAVVQSLDTGPSVVAGLCGECCAAGRGRERLIAALTRDFGGGVPMDIRSVHEEHSA
jgi:hypothetical protein